MITDPYVPGQPYGATYGKIITLSASKAVAKNDDFLLIIAGTTGTGKTSLGLHTYDGVCPSASVEQVALTRADFAKALQRASIDNQFRYVQYDEGKLNRREWHSDWSKELLEIYHDIRGLNIYHVWCTAFPNLLDREFVTERVKGFVYIYTKDESVRRFLYFTKDDLVKFMDANNGKISLKLLKKFGRVFATLDSWFVKYQGHLWGDYEEKKDDRMKNRVQEFYQKWGSDDWLSDREVAAQLKVSHPSVGKWKRDLVADGLLIPKIDFLDSVHSSKNSPKAVALLLQKHDESMGKRYRARPVSVLPAISNSYNARGGKNA
jgi:hypothetical protein